MIFKKISDSDGLTCVLKSGWNFIAGTPVLSGGVMRMVSYIDLSSILAARIALA